MAKSKLAVVWSCSDPDVAEKVCFMYAKNAKKNNWFDEVKLIVWGPSSKLLSENEVLQNYIQEMQDYGVEVEACVKCAEMYGVDGQLSLMGIDVKPMGVPLTGYLKEGWHVLTF